MLFLSIAVQRCWYEMKTSVIVDVIDIHFLSPMIDDFFMNHRRAVPGFYMGATNFCYDNFFWFFAIIAKALFKNMRRKILSQLFSKTIDTTTFYDLRGIVQHIYYDNRQVGCIFYLFAKVCTPCALWGTKSPKGPWYRDEALERMRSFAHVGTRYLA